MVHIVFVTFSAAGVTTAVNDVFLHQLQTDNGKGDNFQHDL